MRNKQFLSFSLMILIFFLLSISLYRHLLASFLNNIGWNSVVAVLQEHTVNGNSPMPDSGSPFRVALEIFPKYESAALGQGIMLYLQGKYQQGMDVWNLIEFDIKREFELGGVFEKNGNNNLALAMYRNVSKKNSAYAAISEARAVRQCQTHFASLKFLSFDNQYYCQNFFEGNNINLLYNGGFDLKNTSGWMGQFMFVNPLLGTTHIDLIDGRPEPSLSISTFDDLHRLGLYQGIELIPGTTVRFKGDFRVHVEDNISVSLLYVEWKENGKIHGNQAKVISTETQWFSDERVFTLPKNGEGTVLFYPVLIQGKGIVDIDNIEVQIK